MANITRIKAKDSSSPPESDKPKAGSKSDSKPKAEPKAELKSNSKPKATISDPALAKQATREADKAERRAMKRAKKAERRAKKEEERKNRKPLPKPIRILVKPFAALGAYIKHAWHELRQVRWPNRKTTWKMTLAVLFYTGIFIAFIMLLDALFTALFNALLG